MTEVEFSYFREPSWDLSGKGIHKKLKMLLREDQVSIRWPERLSYGRDCNSKGILWVREGKVPYPAQWIVWPENVEQISKIVSLANEEGVPIIPFGGGSGVCGGTWAIRGGISLDLKRMDQVLEVDTRRMIVRVQSGMNGELFERELNRRSLTLGHFPSSIYSATVGGYMACRSAGQFSSRYGKIEDMVEGLQVVLPNGTVAEVGAVHNRPRIWDLKEVFLGSEGTLGVLTEGTFKIHPQPDEQVFLGYQFRNLEKGIRAAREIMQHGLKPSVLRLYDPLDSVLASSYKEDEKDESFFFKALVKILHPALSEARNYSLKMALKKARLAKGFLDFLPAQCLMILGFQGSHSQVAAESSYADGLCRGLQGKPLGEGPGRYWFKHRYSVSYKLSPFFDEGFFADTLETATYWKNLPHLYHSVREAIGRHALVMAHFSHAYPEGCSIYFTFLGYRESDSESRKLYDQIWREALDACVAAGGTISHHHGIGVLKAQHMRKEWGDAFDWLCKLKKELDPNNIMNPGKLGFPLEFEKK